MFNDSDNMNTELKEIVNLLRYLLIVNLYSFGMSQGEIAKHLHLSKSTVNDLLKGLNKKGEGGGKG